MPVVFTIKVMDEDKMKAMSMWPTSITHIQLQSTCALSL